MFCWHCGRENEEGRRFCVFCGAEQKAAAAAGGGEAGTGQASGSGPGTAPRGGMSTATRVIIAVVAALVVIGAGVGIYFAVSGSSSSKPPTTQDKTDGSDNTVVQSGKAENLAYINGGDIYTVSLNGAGQSKLTGRGDIDDFAVSPDGSWIAFVAAPGSQKVIFKMKPDGSDVSQVTLPEKGLAENPAFDPTGKYIYFTRVTPGEQANIEAATPFAVGFERYSIAANKVDHLYTYGGMQEQSIQWLYADPASGDLYFNLYGSDWPSSVQHKLSLGPPVTESTYMPMLRDTGVYSAVAFQLTDFSRTGSYVSFFKAELFADQGQGTSQQQVDACFKRSALPAETVVASYELAASQQGQVSGMEFSNISNPTYYFSKVQSAGQEATSLTLQFYKGTTGGSAAPTGLGVTISVDPQQYTPLVWHLLAVEK